jgi:hypothetical protein
MCPPADPIAGLDDHDVDSCGPKRPPGDES